MIKTKLYEVRVQKEILQEEMANLVGMKQSTYSRKERGVTDMTMEEWILMARVLEVKVDDIYRPNLKSTVLGKAENRMTNVSLQILNELEELKKENAALKKELQLLKEQNGLNQQKAV